MATGGSVEGGAETEPAHDIVSTAEVLQAVEAIVNSRFFRTSPSARNCSGTLSPTPSMAKERNSRRG